MSYNELPGITEIGCGYDVNGDYASTLSIKVPLFDLYKNGEETVSLDPQNPSQTFKLPKTVTFHRSNTTNYDFASGTSSTELCNSMNTKTSLEGSYGPFSASLSVDFSSSELSTTFYNFSRVQYSVNLYTLQMGTDAQLKALLTPDAQRDINTMDPTRLFDHYGCYYIASLVMGGRSVMGASTSKYSYQAQNSLEVVAKASFGGMIGSASGEVSEQLKRDMKSFNESSKVNILTKGGDSQYGSRLPEMFQEWSKSVQQFPLLVDFLNGQSLRGIWNLADSETRKNTLKNAAIQYLKDHASPIDQHDGPVLQGRNVNLIKVYSDAGSGSKKDIGIWKPNLGSGDKDWYYLGQTAFGDSGDHSSATGLAVREIVKGVLGDIGGWTKVWSDAGSGNKSDYNMYHPSAASNVTHVTLGSFFRGPVGNQNPPTAAEADKLRAVHRSFVSQGSAGTQIWNDAGSGARQDGSAWTISNPSGTTSAKTFIASGSHSKPSTAVFGIKNSAIATGSKSLEELLNEQLSGIISKFGTKSFRPEIAHAPLAKNASLAAYVHYKFDKSPRIPPQIKNVPVGKPQDQAIRGTAATAMPSA